MKSESSPAEPMPKKASAPDRQPLTLKLPDSIADRRDILACLQALDQVDDQLIDQVVRVRAELTDQPQAVRLPALVQDIMQANKQTLHSQRDVEQLRTQLDRLAAHAPSLELHFASEPDERLRRRLVTWLRANIHPALLVEIRIRAQMAGGFLIETPRRRFDFSWKTQLNQHQNRLIDLLRQGSPSSGS